MSKGSGWLRHDTPNQKNVNDSKQRIKVEQESELELVFYIGLLYGVALNFG